MGLASSAVHTMTFAFLIPLGLKDPARDSGEAGAAT
jgi:hypothetical protein